MSTLKTIELYTLNEWLVLYTHYISKQRERETINVSELLETRMHVALSPTRWEDKHTWDDGCTSGLGSVLPWETSVAIEKAQGLGKWEILHRRYFKLQAQKLHPVTVGGDTIFSSTVVWFFTWFSQVGQARWTVLFFFFSSPNLRAQSLIPSLGWLGCDWGWSQRQDLELPVWADLSLPILTVSPMASFLQKAFPYFHLLAYPTATAWEGKGSR